MNNKEKITQAVYLAIDEVNTMLPRDEQLSKSLDFVMSGNISGLDSLQLMNLIVAVEQQVEIHLNESILLADERAMIYEPSPFSTIGALIDYIEIVLYK